ncbi:MAG: DUF2267 domain-containing protein [Balneolaceae bacterium]|nr:DUF2267 domain-containing protein [Balneolaceae bacterium]
MTNTNLNFEKFAQEAHEYVNQLAVDLGHPQEQEQCWIAWRAVMHTIRDRIHLGESFDLMSQLPMILKGTYAENWKYHEKPPLNYETTEEMKKHVKTLQNRYGEMQFNWSKPTEEIISIIIDSLNRYCSKGQMEHIRGMMPKDVKELVS